MESRKRLELAINSLNNATYEQNSKQTNLISVKVSFDEANETVTIEKFMEACENIPIELEHRIPDLVADVYNELKDELDEGKLVLSQSESKTKAVSAVSKKFNKEKPSNNREELPRFGLRQGSMAYAIVVALETGITKESMVKQLMKDFGRTAEAAENKFFNDLKNLKKYGAKINIENEIYKLGGRE